MKKYLMTMLTFMGLFTVIETVEAVPSGPYVSAFGGVNFCQETLKSSRTDFSTGYALGGAIGYKFCSPFRVEGEFAYRHNNFDSERIRIDSQWRDVDLTINTYTYMVNGYYDFEFDCPIVPYLGAGLGFASGDYKVVNLEEKFEDYGHGNALAGQLMAGVNYSIDNKTGIGLEYRYLHAINSPYTGVREHEILVNIRRYF